MNIDSSRMIICHWFPIYQASVSNFRLLRDVWKLAIIHSRRKLILAIGLLNELHGRKYHVRKNAFAYNLNQIYGIISHP